MPIFIQYDGIKGRVDPKAATGGVWKTTNFLTTDSGGLGWVPNEGRGALQNVAGNNTWTANAVPVSRISMTPGGGGVEGRDPAAKIKVEQLLNTARSQGPTGRLYLATEVGVYAGAANNRGKLIVGVDNARSLRPDAQGRLLTGTDGGVWRKGSGNNLRQLTLGTIGTVEIIVTDASGSVEQTYRLRNVSISRGPSSGTFTLTFNGQTTGG